MLDKKNRLMLVVTILLSSGFLATSFASYFASRSSLRQEITFNSLPLTSDNIYSEIQRDLLRPVFICSLMANDTFLRDWVINGEKNEKEIAKYLNSIKIQYGTFTSFFVSDISGNYYYADGILKKISPDEERDIWYYRVRKMDSDYEINIDPDLSNNDAMTIFINYKVFDYDNNFIGATGVGLTVNAVLSLINEYQQKYRRNIFFIDMKGKTTLRGANLSDAPSDIHDMAGISDFADKLLEGKNETYTYRKNGKTYYLNTRFISEFDWILLVEETDEDAAKAILKTLIINLAICIIITLIVFILIRITISSYQKRIEKLASTDKLTGLLNRLAFDLLMEQAIKESERDQADLSFIIIDIDFFKAVNDTFGHLNGDEVLKKTSECIKSQLRGSDILCRWGGEEFFILLKNCGIEDACITAEKIRKTVKDNSMRIEGKQFSITISCGVSQFKESDTFETVLKRADLALYAAKKNGRDRIDKEI